MNINMPEGAKAIIRQIEKEGFEAYIVGGCVRDALLGREPKDWDITTSAKPEQVKALFKKTIDTGLKHGTVTVLMQDDAYEVTTYRIDGDYLDGRHPETVEYTALLSEDLKRRDFTINAMAYHPERGVIDLFDGRSDLDNHIIRCVGKAQDRFDEDALRMMRAVRFAAQLNFSIEEETAKAIGSLAQTITKISHERVRDELVKLLISDNPERVKDLYELGITQYIFPEFDRMMECEQNTPYHCHTVGGHTIEVIKGVPATVVLRMSALLHDLGKLYTKTTVDGVDHFYGHPVASKKRAEEILRDLKFDNDTIKRITNLVEHHDPRFERNKPNVRRLMNKVGSENFEELLLLMRADIGAKSELGRQAAAGLDEMEILYHEIAAAKDPVDIKSLAINGDDLIGAGVARGKILGETLKYLLESVMNEPELNTKEKLLELAFGYISSKKE